MKKITDFSISCYGATWPDYFQGHGSHGWDGALLGAGVNRAEAVDDLLTQVAEHGLDIKGLKTALRRARSCRGRCLWNEYDSQMYYIGINWNEEKES